MSKKGAKSFEAKAENDPRNEDEVYRTCGGRDNDERRILVGQTLNCATLDCACFSNVCGFDRLHSYLKSLPDEKLTKVSEEESKTTFIFGDGVVVWYLL